MSSFELISDHSKEKLQEVPKKVLESTNLKMLFLEGNFLYKLPEDFFWKLPRLVWLDLRNNQLESIPKSIAHHEFLENLLLTNNNLKKLPNELGLVPKLKALQVSDNPLLYPARKIIVEGTKAIKTYLKEQYEKTMQTAKATEEKVKYDNSKDKREEEQEELIRVEDLSSSDDNANLKLKYSKAKKKKDAYKEIKQTIKNKLQDPHALQPTLNVQKLSHSNVPKSSEKKIEERKQAEPLRITHRICRNGETISLTSCLDRVGGRSSTGKHHEVEKGLREGWLNQLRILLSDQERILQQERSLKALSDWRTKKRTETPKVFYDNDVNKPSSPPFATYPEYEKMPSRKALAAQLNNFFKEQRLTSKCIGDKGQNLNIDKLINDLVEQLKEMEHTYDSSRSPRSEVAAAEKQIKTVSIGPAV
ncbi:hypothetical protein NQ315_013057, partial [Exocentrus adspersus]